MIVPSAKLAACVVVVASLVVSCSSSHAGSGTASSPAGISSSASGIGSSAPPSSSAAPNLASLALRVADLPAGWAVNDTSGATATEPGCLANVHGIAGGTATEKLDVSFAQNGSLPQLDENLGYVPGGKVAEAFSRAVSVVSACKQLDFTSAGQKISGTIGRMPFPSIGDQSAAYTASLSAAGYHFVLDLAMFRKGDLVCLVLYINVAPAPVSQFQPYVTKAAAKL